MTGSFIALLILSFTLVSCNEDIHEIIVNTDDGSVIEKPVPDDPKIAKN